MKGYHFSSSLSNKTMLGNCWKYLEISEDIIIKDDLNESFPDIILEIDYIILAFRMVRGPNELGFDILEMGHKYFCFYLGIFE